MKKVFKIIGAALLSIISFVLIYLGVEYTLSRISGQKEITISTSKDYTIYVLSNGVHTDIALPINNAIIEWNNLFPYNNVKAPNANYQYVAIGWGDKGFYLNTPEWKDLKFKTAFDAVLGLGETALHVTYYPQLSENSLCKPYTISAEQYQILVDYIKASLDTTHSAPSIYIQTNAQYGNNDAFYEARGSYSLFHTCNTWSNTALKKAQLPCSVWAAFDTGIMSWY